MIDYLHEEQRCRIVAFGCAGAAPSAGRSGRSGWDDPTGSGPNIRCHAADHRCLGQKSREQKPGCFGRKAARSAQRKNSSAPSSKGDRASDLQQASRPVEAAFLPVDERSCGTINRKAIWGASFGLDGGAVLAGVGFYTAEADPAGVRSGSGSGPAMVGGGISGDQSPGPAG